MSTGSAIILSTILLIVSVGAWRISVAHRWGTVGKVLGVIILLIAVIIGGIYAYQWYQERPKVVNNLSGIRIGMIEAEVFVEMGEPDSVTKHKTYKVLRYTKEYDTAFALDVSVSSKDNKVDVLCEQGEFTDPYLSSYVSESELIERFGEPEATFIDPNGSYKTLAYPSYNLTFIIRSGNVSEVCLSNKAQGYLA
jgi:hypothetical protein